jgi:hypothetical protein
MCVSEYLSSHPWKRPLLTIGVEASPAPTDPYFFALADCIHRARQNNTPSSCRFSSPLDQMDFGQKHCDARCAALAGVSANP